MDYSVRDKTIITDNRFFDVRDTLECGQMFRFRRYGEGFFVNSLDKICFVKETENKVIIETEDTDYFVNYFDLNNDYKAIIKELQKDIYLKEILENKTGIRICNQNPFEMIISFIISQNNNIPRIKGIIDKLCSKAGKDMGDYHAFPTLKEMLPLDISFYQNIGCGYRANYLFETVKAINNGFDIDSVYSMAKADAKKYLMSLKGVGEKVADCILLFGYHKTECFPVDVWIDKVYRDLTGDNKSGRKAIEEFFSKKYGVFSGYAQQYLFHSKRTEKK